MQSGTKIPYGSESYRRKNPHLFRKVEASKPEPDTKQALDGGLSPQAEVQSRLEILVRMCSHRRRLLDDDNLVGAFKPLRDEIARTVGIDDGDARIKFECYQRKTTGDEEVIVEIIFL